MSARHATFESVIQATTEELNNPEILRSLGVLGVDFLGINNNAFLPNIRKGVIKIPQEYRDTNNIAVLPVNFSDLAYGLTLNITNYHPKAHKLWPWRRSTAIGSISGIDMFGNALTVAPQVIIANERSLARPLVLVDEHLPYHFPDRVGSTQLHEYVHVSDALHEPSVDVLASPRYTAYTELRAYFAAGEVQRLREHQDPDALEISTEMNQLRESFGLGVPTAIDEVPDELVSQLLSLHISDYV